MPELMQQPGTIDEFYIETKGLRLNQTKKRLRHLPAFEHVHYKKTFLVKKTGHNLEDIHRLDDGGLRYTMQNLSYSLNKRKRWLLPEIIEQRICEYEPKSQNSKSQQDGQISAIDERLKIVMYENENIRHSSSCFRYANSQTTPHIVHNNGRKFNSTTLTKWMNFDTREHRGPRYRHRDTNRVNLPNFGVEQRPGFFPSEVTYEFLYPKRSSTSLSHQQGKSSLLYRSKKHDRNSGRYRKDKNQNRRQLRRTECLRFDRYGHDYSFEVEKESVDNEEFITAASALMNEAEKWSIVFDDTDDQSSTSIDFPIDYFIPLPTSNHQSTSPLADQPSDTITDHKAHKYFEPPPTPIQQPVKSLMINEAVLCSIPCENESDFLALMQQSTMRISQANLAPAVFLQRTPLSSFVVIYTYCRTSSTINATLKYMNLLPNLNFDKNKITLENLIELVSRKLDEHLIEIIQSKSASTTRTNVDDLRGSLPLPMKILQNMLLVRPHSTDKQTALQIENIITDNKDLVKQWFETTKNDYEMLECSICCEILTTNDAYQLLPCHHTLCHTCLISYVRTSVASATYSSSSLSPITCFQPSCSTQLNPSLLQAFLSFDIYQSYVQSLIDRRLFSSGNYRKCPSRACSNLLIVNDKTNVALMCTCGQRACSTCFEEYHFPATCQQYKSYVKRLRASGDDLLSVSKFRDNSSCYIAEGKNCPSCGEFVEKNGGCPHMTCKCGNEYCWACLKRWSTHVSATCFNIPESIHELRSSARNRLFNKAIDHRRQRNEYTFNSLSIASRRSSACPAHHDIILSTYIDLNTLAEFLYVLLQRRRTNVYIRAVLGQTANRLASEALQIRTQIEQQQIKMGHIEQIRFRLQRTLLNLLHMKKNKVLL